MGKELLKDFEFYQEKNFKQTEIGEIPEDWEAIELGKFIEEKKKKNINNNLLKVYSISNIYGFMFSDDFFDKQVYSKNLKNYKIVEKFDFAYNPARVNVGSIGLFINSEPGLVSPMYVVFRINKPDNLINDFLFLILKSDKYINEIKRISMSRGSVRQILSFNDLSQILIPLPSLEEQRAIAGVLSIIQEAKEKTEEVIKATKELKKSMMKHLFTYGPVPLNEIDKVKLKQTEIGEIPEDWEIVRLGDMCEKISNGITKSQNKQKKGYLVTRIETISNGKINVDKAGYIENLTLQEIEKYKLLKYDILISHINSEPQLGNSAIYEGHPLLILHGMNLLLIRTIKNKLNPYFLNYLFPFYKSKGIFISIASRAVNQSSINQQKFKNLLIPFPPLPIQQQIADILLKIDEKIQKEEERKKALENLFKSMLHNLMSGKIRIRLKEGNNN